MGITYICDRCRRLPSLQKHNTRMFRDIVTFNIPPPDLHHHPTCYKTYQWGISSTPDLWPDICPPTVQSEPVTRQLQRWVTITKGAMVVFAPWSWLGWWGRTLVYAGGGGKGQGSLQRGELTEVLQSISRAGGDLVCYFWTVGCTNMWWDKFEINMQGQMSKLMFLSGSQSAVSTKLHGGVI